MTEPSQAECNRLAALHENAAKLLRNRGAKAFRLAADWDGTLAGTSANPGSRSTGPNDIGERLLDRAGNVRVPAEFAGAHDRMIAAFRIEAATLPTYIADLTFCQVAEKTQREETNRLDRVNSRTGECETCYTAGRPDSYQEGTLERVVLTESTLVDGEHQQLDLCRKCAKSAHGARAAACSSGRTWNPLEWTEQRIEHLRAQTAGDDGSACGCRQFFSMGHLVRTIVKGCPDHDRTIVA